VNVEADALFLEVVHQLRGKARQVHAQALNPVVEVWIHHLDHGVAAAVVDVHSGDPTRFHVVEEAAVAHPGHGCVARSCGGSIGAEVPTAQHLDAQETNHGHRQEPEGQYTPALIHS